MPDDASAYEHEIDRAHRRAFGNYTPEEWRALPTWARVEAMTQRERDWIAGLAPTPYLPCRETEPVLRGSAAVGAAYVAGLRTVGAILLLLTLSACAQPEVRPMAGLTLTVKVVPPSEIATACAGAPVPMQSVMTACFAPATCTAYLPAGVDQMTFIDLLDHEIGRHGLGEEHDLHGAWLPVNPALQMRCVRS